MVCHLSTALLLKRCIFIDSFEDETNWTDLIVFFLRVKEIIYFKYVLKVTK